MTQHYFIIIMEKEQKILPVKLRSTIDCKIWPDFKGVKMWRKNLPLGSKEVKQQTGKTIWQKNVIYSPPVRMSFGIQSFWMQFSSYSTQIIKTCILLTQRFTSWNLWGNNQKWVEKLGYVFVHCHNIYKTKTLVAI